MAILFFDSSSLVKRYVAETGTAWVQELTDQAAGHRRFIAQITGVEMIAAVTRRLRRGDLAPAEAATALAEIQADFGRDYLLLEASLPRVREAMALAERHGLRGYDAVQLATALFLRGRCRAAGMPDPILIAADGELNRAAGAEGFTVDDPNQHP